MLHITADFTKDIGVIKPLHGINNSPMTYGESLPELQKAGIPYLRTHDTAAAFGGTHFVDIPNLFPDFNADPEDETAYDFTFTDAYFKGIYASGIKVFYRLGVTIENHYKVKAYRINPPENPEKFARICEHVILHYNEGWANGFHYGIEYWEIWNEPENPMMWTGTREQFFDFYGIVSRHLKKKFPSLKIGGYAGCGFYGMNRPDEKNDFTMSFVTWFDDFLKYVTSPATACPLDFFSWHLYTQDPFEIVMHAEYVEKKLHEAGLDSTENIFDEWNYIDRYDFDTFEQMRTMTGSAFIAASFIMMQYSPIDKAMYYDALPTRYYGGIYNFPTKRVAKPYWSFLAFNRLYQLEIQIEIPANPAPNVFLLGAGKGKDGAILAVNTGTIGVRIEMKLNGMKELVSGKRLDRTLDLEETTVVLDDGTLILPGQSVTLLEYKK